MYRENLIAIPNVASVQKARLDGSGTAWTRNEKLPTDDGAPPAMFHRPLRSANNFPAA